MDPTLKTNTTAALLRGISSFSPQMRVAAKYVLDHPSDFGLDSIRETARKAGVSTYTLVNMARIMGFVTFEALRQPYRHALVSASSMPADTAWLDAQRDTSDLGSAYVDAAKNALSIVSTSLERQTLAELEAVADLLVQADRVYLTAVRASYALAYYLHYVGRMALPSIALIPRHRNSAMDDLVDATPSDVLIAISVTPYSRETIEACAFAQKRGVKLILIADSEVVSPDLTPKHTLVASVLSTHKFGCFTGMMAVLELLIAILMRRGGADAEDRIEAYDNHRTANHAYWSTQKKH